jgi:hypothetical protein
VVSVDAVLGQQYRLVGACRRNKRRRERVEV